MGSATYLEGAAPPTPPSGYVVFYAKTDSLLYMKDDAGAEVPIKPVGGGTGDLLSDGTVPLVANWELGAFILTALSLVSDVVTGTAPFVVVSTTVVANLNASLLEGNAAAAFATAAQGSTADAALPKAGGEMSGNITMAAAETVDGRDLSVDGTKLDGIESAATADQTGAEIKTAYELEADTNAYDDAAVSKLGGIEATADITDAANVAAAGAVMDSDISEAEGFVRKTGAGAYEAIKSNLSAAVAPTVNEDSGDGYAVGSIWIDTTADKAYVCLDATVTSAVWIEVTQSGSGAVVTTKGDLFGYDTTNKRIPVGANGEHLEADSTQALGLKWAVPSGGGGGMTVKHKSANYTAVAGEIVFCDSSGGAFTVTLPITPSGDDRVTVVDSSGSAGTNNITVARNGETILGAAEDFVLNQNFGKADFSYEGVGTDWKHALSGLS